MTFFRHHSRTQSISGVTIMAVHVGRQVRVAACEDGIMAVQRDIIVDPQTGRAVEVEKIAVAVDTGDGNIAVAEQQRIVGVAAQVREGPAYQPYLLSS